MGGAGKVFEGDKESFYKSLNLLSKLPNTTLVLSGHDYGLANIE